MKSFDSYVNETFEMLSERSINKINKDFTETVNKMAEKATEYKEAEGAAKEAILAELKELNDKKKELTKELDKAVAGKDRNVELAITEAKRAGLSKKETLKVAQKFAAALTKLDGKEFTVSADYEEDSFDLDVDGDEYAGGSYIINADGSVVNMATWNRKTNVSPTYGNMDDDIKTIIKTIKNLSESIVNEEEPVTESTSELKKLEDAIKMFQDKIKGQGRVTNARDEEHLEKLVRIYKEMGGKNIKESLVNEASGDLKVGDSGIDYNDNVVEIVAIGRYKQIAKMFKKEMKADAEEEGFEELMVNTDYYLTKNIQSPEGNVGDFAIYPVRYDMANYWGLDPLDESVVSEGKTITKAAIEEVGDSRNSEGYSSNEYYILADFVDGEITMKDLAKLVKSREVQKELKGESEIDMEYLEEFSESVVTEAHFKIGDDISVTRNDGKVFKGKVEKTNPLKIRTSPTDTIVIGDRMIKNIVKESVVTEARVTLKRRYTENHPAVTVSKNAKVRNRVLEFIKDGKITQEAFEKFVADLSNNSKRWTKNNSRYFTISEEGVSLSKMGKKLLTGITVNEGKVSEDEIDTIYIEGTFKDGGEFYEDQETTDVEWVKKNYRKITKDLKSSEIFIRMNNGDEISYAEYKKQVNEATTSNPGVWVPGEFDKELNKLPNSKITLELVSKLAKKYKIDLEDAIKYVEYGWAMDLNENKTSMKTKFIYESFGAFVNSLNESTEAESILNDLLDERGGDMDELHGMEMEDALDTVEAYGHKGSKANKIAKELLKLASAIGESVVNEAKSFSEGELKSTAQSVADAVAKVNKTKAKVIDFKTLDKDGKIAGFYIHKATNTHGAPSRYWITDSGEVVSAFRHDTFGDGVVGKVGSSVANFIKTFKANESLITEAFASTKLASILTGGNKMDKDLPKAFYNMSKIALDKIQDVDIIEMDPATAKKEKRANAIYMYFTTNAKENPYAGRGAWSGEKDIPANTLLAITNGQNEWMATEWQRSYSNKQKPKRTLKVGKREDAAGFKKSGRGEYNSGISSMKQVAELADRAYVLDLDILRARYSTVAKRDERTAAKKGAVAFQDDKEFKAENMNRYNTIITNRAAKMPIDKMVAGAIDTISKQIKDGLAKGEKGRYGEIVVGRNKKGKEGKLSDAARHMQNILDEFQRYVNDTNQAEVEKNAGYDGNYYAGRVKQSAKEITDKIKQIDNFGYVW